VVGGLDLCNLEKLNKFIRIFSSVASPKVIFSIGRISTFLAVIEVEVEAAGIGIPASCISVRYRSIPVPDWVPLFRYPTGSGIGFFVHSGTGLTGLRTVRHSGI
jgi:hypothetical protein